MSVIMSAPVIMSVIMSAPPWAVDKVERASGRLARLVAHLSTTRQSVSKPVTTRQSLVCKPVIMSAPVIMSVIMSATVIISVIIRHHVLHLVSITSMTHAITTNLGRQMQSYLEKAIHTRGRSTKPPQ
jgi:hypothetical protein